MEPSDEETVKGRTASTGRRLLWLALAAWAGVVVEASRAGEAAGLMPVTLMTQREFLTNLGAEVLLDAIAALDGPKQAELKGLRSLLDPAGLGGFRVLVQAKGAPAADLACLDGEAERRDLKGKIDAGLQPPRLTPAHLNQLAGRPGGWTEWSPT